MIAWAEGDKQADLMGHGGEHRALMVYQIESYRYWQDFLGRDDFTMGQFGENLRVSEMADDQVCVGDRYRVGGAVLEVSLPLVTCPKVGIRLNDERMPALLLLSLSETQSCWQLISNRAMLLPYARGL